MSLRVLIVDDHQIVALGVADVLQQLGHEVIASVTSGLEAIETATRLRPDVVIMDIELKGDTDGITAAFNIKRELGIPSIFFSGHLGEEIQEAAANAEPIAFLPKTASIEVIREVLSRVKTS